MVRISAHRQGIRPCPRLSEDSSRPSVHVTAHLDGKARGISHWVLSGAKDLRKAHQKAPQKIEGKVQVSRRHPIIDAGMGLASSLVPISLFALSASIATQGAVGMGLLLGAFGAKLSLLTSNGLLTALKARRLSNKRDQNLSGERLPAPEAKSPEDRLRANVVEAKKMYPQARHVVYLSGHGGDGKTVAGLKLAQLRDTMKDTRADVTILDTCSSCSLEVMGNLAPWAGLVAASSHVVYAFGFPLDEVLSPENAAEDSTDAMAKSMAKACSKWTHSMNLIDTGQMKEHLMPALGELAKHLNSELKEGNGKIRRAFRKTDSVGLLPGRNKYLASFLQRLENTNLAPKGRELLERAVEELKGTVVQSQNEFGLTFHSLGDESLPPEWNGLMKNLRIFGVV